MISVPASQCLCLELHSVTCDCTLAAFDSLQPGVAQCNRTKSSSVFDEWHIFVLVATAATGTLAVSGRLLLGLRNLCRSFAVSMAY